MEENNKLIAEFMGVNLITIDDIRANKNPYISSVDGYTKEDLQFHTSWDWLMPVINKCFDVAEDGQMSDIMHHLQVAEMDSTYDAVVEFIINYNKSKKDFIVTDYFVYDRAKNSILKYDGHTQNGEIIFYADKQEAIDDLYGNEEVCDFNILPEDKQEEIINELKSRKF